MWYLHFGEIYAIIFRCKNYYAFGGKMITEIKKSDPFRFTRLMYIIEAALEYFVSMLSGGAYLALLTNEIGISDSTTGILTSFVSLGFGFQMIALFISNKGSAKKWVTPVHMVDQLLFTLLYIIPFFDVSKNVKSALLIAFLLIGRIITNIVYSHKINWLMGTVDEDKRGKFTALKEMVSLLSGMLFTFVMGRIIDEYRERGNVRGAFIVCGITMFILMFTHTLTLILSKERPKNQNEIDGSSIKAQITGIFRCKNFWKILPALMLWSIASYISTPFFGTYQIGELAFTMTFISVISMISALTRALVSLPIGGLADKQGFSRMMMLCYVMMCLAFSSMAFTTPATKYLYIAYSILHAIGMAGMNSGELNIVLDYTSRELRVGAIAIKGTICGFTGFFSTLAVTPLVDHIQANGNKLFGMHVYAQQVTSAISVVCCILALAYMTIVVKKLKRNA